MKILGEGFCVIFCFNLKETTLQTQFVCAWTISEHICLINKNKNSGILFGKYIKRFRGFHFKVNNIFGRSFWLHFLPYKLCMRDTDTHTITQIVLQNYPTYIYVDVRRKICIVNMCVNVCVCVYLCLWDVNVFYSSMWASFK